MKNHLKPYLGCLIAVALAAAPQAPTPDPAISRALSNVSPASLRGNLSFIASDLLEGRDTPSRGLDIAAEYIAAQFRTAGLEPAGGSDYFQTARMLHLKSGGPDFSVVLQDGNQSFVLRENQVAAISLHPLEISSAPVVKIRELKEISVAEIRGKVVFLAGGRHQTAELAKAVVALNPAALVEVSESENDPAVPRLLDPDQARQRYADVARIIVRDPEARKLLRGAKENESGLALSIHAPEPTLQPVSVRNVVGLLRGSDPTMRDQYLLVTAHYDHVGMPNPGQIFRGANDDGSGTVSVIEIAKALATLPVRPKRSIVFMTFFGEEEGSLGANYYACHPLFPLDKTVVDLNLEQVGRTDSNSGPKVANASLTGFAYSNVAKVLQRAGEMTGIKVYETSRGDEFFERSDNETFAEHGIPAHTIVVAFEYPDYHAVGDTWQKIDYDNMAKVDRMIALGAIMIGNNPDPPRWNRGNPNAARFFGSR